MSVKSHLMVVIAVVFARKESGAVLRISHLKHGANGCVVTNRGCLHFFKLKNST
jgi:hypothetical protein